jgi:hypothetical protein
LICYASFGYLLATSTPAFSRFTNELAAQLRWLLPAAAFFDAVENIAHLCMLALDEAITPIAVALSGTSSLLKWLMIIAFVIAPGTAYFVRRR